MSSSVCASCNVSLHWEISAVSYSRRRLLKTQLTFLCKPCKRQKTLHTHTHIHTHTHTHTRTHTQHGPFSGLCMDSRDSLVHVPVLPLTTVSPWANYLNPLCLSCLMCNMETRKISSSQACSLSKCINIFSLLGGAPGWLSRLDDRFWLRS